MPNKMRADKFVAAILKSCLFRIAIKAISSYFKGENQECLFEGLISIFEHIGGVPPRIWFDNTKTIVTRVLKEGGRHPDRRFSALL